MWVREGSDFGKKLKMIDFYSRFSLQGLVCSWALYQTKIEEAIEQKKKREYMETVNNDRDFVEEISTIESIMKTAILMVDASSD